ncbi:hypothetical protein [Caballeronia novacaledonica]|uniref:hypothetical protein n=1 Tax=Caballeronia novacaledonica TaxID=1544861 RepID=UPI0015E65CA3|nr:hypothetical protein [Caballeronia novacaledonica]
MNMNNCHDWTLIGLSVNWQIGELQIEMLDSSSQRRVWVARNLVSLVLPRQHPWGPSVSINEVSVSNAGNGVTAKLEVQSGDVIECIAGSFDLH